MLRMRTDSPNMRHACRVGACRRRQNGSRHLRSALRICHRSQLRVTGEASLREERRSYANVRRVGSCRSRPPSLWLRAAKLPASPGTWRKLGGERKAVFRRPCDTTVLHRASPANAPRAAPMPQHPANGGIASHCSKRCCNLGIARVDSKLRRQEQGRYSAMKGDDNSGPSRLPRVRQQPSADTINSQRPLSISPIASCLIANAARRRRGR